MGQHSKDPPSPFPNRLHPNEKKMRFLGIGNQLDALVELFTYRKEGVKQKGLHARVIDKRDGSKSVVQKTDLATAIA